MNNSSAIRLYTIGHSDLLFAHFLNLLQQHDIQTLVDVRSMPWGCPAAYFDQEQLRLRLLEAGIAYHFLGNLLGGRPQDTSVYRSGKLPSSWDEVAREVDYPAIMEKPWFQQGITQLLEIAARGSTVILCAEENPQECHRKHLVARSLPMQVEVLHIRADGSLNPELPVEKTG